MPSPERIIVVDQRGAEYEVSPEQVQGAIDKGWTVQSDEGRLASVAREAHEESAGGVRGAVGAFGAGALSGLTLGGSDVLIGALGGADARSELQRLRDINAGAALAGQIVGSLAPVVPGAGSSALIRASPAALASRAGARIAEAGVGGGALARAGAAAAGAAAEGALQNAGAYLSEVAITEKELAADGFIGAMGKGALYGGVAGGALSLSSSGLVAARRLLPKEEVTAAAVARTEQEARQAIESALEVESREAARAARERLRQIREEAAALDLNTKRELDAIAVQKARELAEAQARTATARADAAVARAARAKAGPTSRTRRAFGPDGPPPEPPPSTQAAAPGNAAADDLRPPTAESGAPGVPATAADFVDGTVTTIQPGQLIERGLQMGDDFGRDAGKLAKARRAIAEGQRDPIQVVVSPGGKLDIHDGRHRLAAALEADVPVKVEWSRGQAGMDAAPPAASSAADDTGSDLLAQLQATKSGLDDGARLGALSGSSRDTAVEDALNAHVARTNPEAQRLLAHLGELEESRDLVARWLDKYGGPRGSKVKAFEYAEGMRPRSGYQSVVPEGEGSAALPRGRTSEWRGSDADRAAADARTLAKVSPEDIAAGDEAAARVARGTPRATAADIVAATEREAGGAAPAATIDEQIGKALQAAPDAGQAGFADELDEAVGDLSRLEQKMADLADELGPAAPPRVAERAKGYRDAQARQADAGARAAADAAGDAEKAAATVALGGEVPGRPGAGRMAQVAADAGSMLEALQMLGVPVPDASKIPLVGPLVSAFLKARLASKVFRRLGGKVPETAETVIAGKSAQIRERITTAIDKALEVGAKGAAAAAPKAGGTAAILGHKLFDDGEPAPSGKPGPKPRPLAPPPRADDLEGLYLARADELQRAMQPGAIRDAVRRRVRAADPAVLDAIVAAEERKLGLLYEKMPKATAPASLLGGRQRYVPSSVALSTWAQYLAAAADPADVIEAAAAGAPVASQAAETLRTVYPKLHETALRRLIEKSAQVDEPLALPRRIALSRLLGAPLERSMDPSYAAFLQQGYQAPPPAAQPAPPMGTPTIAADVRAGVRSDPMHEGA